MPWTDDGRQATLFGIGVRSVIWIRWCLVMSMARLLVMKKSAPRILLVLWPQLCKGLSTLNPDSNRFSNWIAQCEFNANSMRIQCVLIVSTLHCAEPNSCVHVDFKSPHLHTATMVLSSDPYFSQPSYCYSHWADTWNTVCSPEKQAHCQ